jgi:hypothetical protein
MAALGAIMRNKLLSTLSAILFFGTAASAGIYNIPYNGVVSYGFDQTGVFGTIDTSGLAYVGMSYTATFVFNTSRGDFETRPGVDTSIGMEGVTSNNPAVLASVMVNGHTLIMTPNSGQLRTFNNGTTMAVLPNVLNKTFNAAGEPIFVNHLGVIAAANSDPSVPVAPYPGQITHIDSTMPERLGVATSAYMSSRIHQIGIC